MVDRLREIEADDLADKLQAAVLVYSGEGSEAVRLLKPMVEDNPTSLGLWALLIQAQDDVGDHEDWFLTAARMDELEGPVRAEDYFQAGMAVKFLAGPALGLEYANKACELWRSAPALLTRGRIKADYSVMTGDLRYAEEAIRDVQAANLLLDEDRGTRVETLATPLLVASAFRASHNEEMYEQCLRDAGHAARAVERQASRHAWEVYYLAQYYRAIGDKQKEIDLYRQVTPDCWTEHFASFYLARVAVLGRKPDELLKEQIRRGECGPLASASLAYLLALDGEVEESKRLSRSWVEGSLWVEPAQACTDVYDLCGEPDKAKELAERQLERFQKVKLDPVSKWIRESLLRFRAGQISKEQLMTAAEESNAKRRWLTYAHWQAAMKHLGEGDMNEAREDLRKCQSQHCIYARPNPWAEALLRRLEGVEVWPPQRAIMPPHDAQRLSD
jgi:hypothetical protein